MECGFTNSSGCTPSAFARHTPSYGLHAASGAPTNRRVASGRSSFWMSSGSGSAAASAAPGAAAAVQSIPSAPAISSAASPHSPEAMASASTLSSG